MPLHLAHHKSYHPYNRDNIERVQRDEAIVALQEAQSHASSFTAKDQARLDLLRRQAAKQARKGSDGPSADSSSSSKFRLKVAEREVLQGKCGELEKHDNKLKQKLGQDQGNSSDHVDSNGHINFWSENDTSSSSLRRPKTVGQNADHLKELKETKEKDQAANYFLGRPVKELKPWYTDAELQNGDEKKKTQEQRLEAAYKDGAVKHSHDPLKAMESFLAQRKQISELQRSERERQERLLGSSSRGKGLQGFEDDFNEEYSDMYNRDDVKAAKESRRDEHRSKPFHSDDRGASNTEKFKPRASPEAASGETELNQATQYFMTLEQNGERMNDAIDAGMNESEKALHDTASGGVFDLGLRKGEDPTDTITTKVAGNGTETSIDTGSRKGDTEARKTVAVSSAPHSVSTAPNQVPDDFDSIKSDASGDAKDCEKEDGDVHKRSGGDESFSSDSSKDSNDGPILPIGENPYRPGTRASMYPELFQQMVCTVLESESYLFSNSELDLLSSFFMMSYAARYLFVRLLQREKDAWYRLDRLTAYEAEVGDLRPAREELSQALGSPSSEGPKVEHARREEELQRLELLLDDKENTTLTLPSLQREMRLDEETRLYMRPGSGIREPFGQSSNLTKARPSTSTRSQQHGLTKKPTGVVQQSGAIDPLCHFVHTEKEMSRGPEESMSLLTLDELKVLAKKMNIAKIGTTRAQVISALLATKSQSTLFSSFSPTKKQPKCPAASPSKGGAGKQLILNFGATGRKTAQTSRLREELAEVLRGGCIQVVPEVRSLVDRVALVYYRGNLLGSAALTAAILARSRRRNYPIYSFKRTSFLFPSRDHLIAFERALEIETKMEQLIQFGKTENDHKEALTLFESVYQEWQDCVEECKQAHPDGIDKMIYHRMRFHPGWILSRVVYKGATCLARFKLYDREKEVLTRLLDQRVFRRGRRGDWYDRLALITALYSGDVRKGKKAALEISIRGIQDPDTHLIYHDTLQRRIGRLESQLRLPKSEQHDFSYAKLKKTTEVTFKGTRLDVMLDEDRERSGNPSAVMKSFLQRKSSSPSLTKALKRAGSDPSSPTKDKESTSGFQVRRQLYKRVKVETFKTEGGDPSTPLRRSSLVKDKPVKDDEDASAATPCSATKAERPLQIKREDTSDSLLDELELDRIDKAALQEDPTALTLGLDPVAMRKETRTSMRSVWRGLDNQPCHVEQLCLQHYALQGFKGVHCEGKILKMIFVLVMWDVIFRDDVEGAFETPFQAAPLDLGSDSFAIVRSKEIRERLSEIEETGGLELIARADDAQRERKTWAVGCRWDMFSKEEVLEVAECLGGHSIAVICQMLCEEWDHCTGGMPDLCIWRMSDKTVRFIEIKGPGDRLSETQKVWIDVLLRAGVDVQVGLVVSRASSVFYSDLLPTL